MSDTVSRMKKQDPDRTPATPNDTVDELARRAKRNAFPLRRMFLQQRVASASRPGPLADFVRAGDRTALLLYFLALTKASHEPWDVSLHSAVWARALGLVDPTSPTARSRVSRAWTRLADRGLVIRRRRKRLAEFVLLREDGSRSPYTRPTKNFIKVPHDLWTHGPDESTRWYRVLNLPELTYLVIGLSNLDRFPLPLERGPDYYGISADTLLRGSQGLNRQGLLTVHKIPVKAPLSPEGITVENRYTLKPPFGPRGKLSRATSSFR